MSPVDETGGPRDIQKNRILWFLNIEEAVLKAIF